MCGRTPGEPNGICIPAIAEIIWPPKLLILSMQETIRNEDSLLGGWDHLRRGEPTQPQLGMCSSPRPTALGAGVCRMALGWRGRGDPGAAAGTAPTGAGAAPAPLRQAPGKLSAAGDFVEVLANEGGSVAPEDTLSGNKTWFLLRGRREARPSPTVCAAALPSLPGSSRRSVGGAGIAGVQDTFPRVSWNTP